MHSNIHAFIHIIQKKKYQFLIPYFFRHPEKTTTFRLQNLTRVNNHKIMKEIEQENVTYKEILDQFQGKIN